ncbi:MAG: hypothetical protein V3U44_07075 [Alphaproteobacteria bacterium]
MLARLRHLIGEGCSEGGRTGPWLALGLLAAAIPGAKALTQAFAGPYVVQDDARQFVAWMARFDDPALFRGDLIADYFNTVTPYGFTALYWGAANLGLDPMVFNKLLGPVLGLLTAIFAFRLAVRLVPAPVAGFLAVALLSIDVWLNDSLASGTPRAFVYPLFLAFLLAVVRRSVAGTVVAIALQGLFYPQITLVSAGVLVFRLLRWQGGPRLSRGRADWLLAVAGLLAAAVTLAPFTLKTGTYGPALTLAEAKTLPGLQPGGRTFFFDDDLWHFYFCALRSGYLPREWGCGTVLQQAPAMAAPYFVALAAAVWALPIWLWRRGRKGAELLVCALVSSTVLFVTAHALLFELHLPSKYSSQPLRMITAVALGAAIASVLTGLLKRTRWRGAAVSGAALLVIGLLIFPLVYARIPKAHYVESQMPAVHVFLEGQPKDALVASLMKEADSLPAFSRMSVLVANEFMIPYNRGYARMFDERARALILAHYSPDPAPLKELIGHYGVDLFLVDERSFRIPDMKRSWWARHYPAEAAAVQARLAKGEMPALKGFIESCSIFKAGGDTVLSAACILKQLQTRPNSAQR